MVGNIKNTLVSICYGSKYAMICGSRYALTVATKPCAQEAFAAVLSLILVIKFQRLQKSSGSISGVH